VLLLQQTSRQSKEPPRYHHHQQHHQHVCACAPLSLQQVMLWAGMCCRPLGCWATGTPRGPSGPPAPHHCLS
jgi:hypothetical protein